MLLRKRGTASAILAVALLVAILASMNSVINHINRQTEMLGGLVNISENYLVLSRNSTSETGSEIETDSVKKLRNVTTFKYFLTQKTFKATLTTKMGNSTISVRGVENVADFLWIRGAYVNGTSAKDEREACLGEILARLAHVNLGDEANLTVSNKTAKVKVVGIIKTLTQSDSELIVPMELAVFLTGCKDKVSLVEFSLQDDVGEEDFQSLIRLLPKDVRIVKVQRTDAFIQEVNAQTLAFLNQWSLVVYAVVMVASHVIATRFVTESTYELTTLRALGAKRRVLFELVTIYTGTVALFGSILGSALGIVGTQVSSTVARWAFSLNLAPFLEVEQAVSMLLLALASSILGCVFPAFRAAHKSYTEATL